MKKILFASILAIVASASHAENNPLNYNILEFQERANVSVPNDTMHITLHIETQNATRQAASQDVTRKLNALQNKIKKYNQLKAEMGSRSVYPQRNNKNQITSWNDSVDLRVKSSDFDAMSQIIAESENEAMLRGVYFSVSPEKRAKAVEQASEQALNAVRQRADFLSKKLGFSGYNFVKVELNDSFEQNNVYAVPAPRMMMKAVAMSESMQVSPDQAGEEEISQNVRVSIQMK